MSNPAEGSSKPAKPEAGTPQQTSLPTISLPKGGGAIRGIGEKFAANPVTGTASLSVPIFTSPGRSGFGPQLSLSYDSGTGNGAFGIGWNLATLPSITRKTDKGLPLYDDQIESDVFILSGSEDLVPALIQVAGDKKWQRDTFARTVNGTDYWIQRYRPRIEGLFARIERWSNERTGEIHWRSISKENITTLYGKTTESRIADPTDQMRIFSWLICESYDDKGNAILYEYKHEDSERTDPSLPQERNRTDTSRAVNRYLKRVKYGNRIPYQPGEDLAKRADWMFEAVFDYGEHYSEDGQSKPNFVSITDDKRQWMIREDPFSSYRAGFEVRTYRLCQRVLMFHHFPKELGINDYLVRSTEFNYSEGRIGSFITGIVQSGYVRLDEGTYYKKSLPPLEFEYSQANVQDVIQEIDTDSLENVPSGLDGSSYQWIDLDGEGLSGILTVQAGAWFYKRNLSSLPVNGSNDKPRTVARFGAVERLRDTPSPGHPGKGQQQFMDLSGHGQQDLVQFVGPLSGFFERTPDEKWETFTQFASLPNIRWDDPNLRFIDLDGDGHADILITEDEAFAWYPSLAERGFAAGQLVRKSLDEEKGPRLVFADGTQSVYLADMSADGLTDLVRIRNGEICYWPNLGYGRFGSKVAMESPPIFDNPDQFEQKRIRLADIDGSGTTDVIYLGRDGIHLYFNQSGNSWSKAQNLSQFPPTDSLSSVTAADLLGNGTACLIWSSPLLSDVRRPMRYIDLMGGEKPHLLTLIRNNMGAETKVTYTPSTKFYLADRLAGKPWITRLPFPVQVVERVEISDFINRNNFVTRYAYHHGYFDGAEREFRGFGMVEQWDTEEIGAAGSETDGIEATNWDDESFIPPVLTRTWFHTGAYFEEGRISTHFVEEYYREGDPRTGEGVLDAEQLQAILLPDTVLSNDLAKEEAREACRSLKGGILRQEIYAHDRNPNRTLTEESGRAYTVCERNYTVKRLQPLGQNRHAVFLVNPRETLDFHYERKLYDVSAAGQVKRQSDPRVTHNLIIEVDDYGNVLKSLTIGYGRRQPDSNLSAQDQRRQIKTLISYTENAYTNPVLQDDAYRVPLTSEMRTFEILNVVPSPGLGGVTQLFLFENLQGLVDTPDFLQGNWDIPSYDIEHTNATGNHPYRRLLRRTRTLYRSGQLDHLLPFNQLDSLALPGETYKLAFTRGLLAAVYQRERAGQPIENLLPNPAIILGSNSPDGGGYLDLEGNGNWWIPSGRIYYWQKLKDDPDQELEFARAHFFLPHRFSDPLGNSIFVAYDSNDVDAQSNHNFLVTETRDPLGNVISAQNNYRVLHPAQVTDPNQAVSEVLFDALSLVVATAIHKGSIGDSLLNVKVDLTQKELGDFFVDPRGQGGMRLATATTYIVYDMERYYLTGNADKPPYAATLARETHASDPEQAGGLKLQISFSYSDGLGREIQKKVQAEPGPVDNVLTNPRWVGSGWTIFNNKGRPVRKYEPFFDNTHEFRFGKRVGVSPILFYDPVERVVATLHPNDTYEKVVFDPWRQETYDVNDTVTLDPRTDLEVRGYLSKYFALRPSTWQTWYSQRIEGARGAGEQEAAKKTESHAETPTETYFDTLGRMFLTVANNGKDANGNALYYETHLDLDLEGNQRSVVDAKGRVVMRYDYDMLGNRVRQGSMEAGTRWMLNNVNGKVIRAWDSRGFTRRMTYDALQRSVELFVANASEIEFLARKTTYGESKQDPETTNHRLKPWRVYDGAGLVVNDSYDFKGNLVQSSRQLLGDYRARVDWAQDPQKEPEIFTSHTIYDALSRPIQIIPPHSDKAGTKLNVIQPTYNEANLLERLDSWFEQDADVFGLIDPNTSTMHIVTNIDYNPKGQRELIEYGNGVQTSYQYDPFTFRLTHVETLRAAEKLQELYYIYDPVGNITTVGDDAQQTIYFNGQVVKPDAKYTYDATYRLIEASGREHIGQALQTYTTWDDKYRVGLAHPNDGEKMRNYAEWYTYDEVGNILRFAHRATSGNWIREYQYDEVSLIEKDMKNNRLSGTILHPNANQPIQELYTHDLHGNMTSMPHLQSMDWDFEDQLHLAAKGAEKTYQIYDAAGQRVRKLIEKNDGALTEERIYLGPFEVFRRRNGEGITTLERETLHIMDDRQRVALVETRTIDTRNVDRAPRQLVRYQYGNHVGSTLLELDGQARVISYEEYYPYGGTSYQAVRSQTETPKRYRYAGKEREEESGFYYYGARYYASWLGRWTACDRDGLADGLNVYQYVLGNPIRLNDPTGRGSNDQQNNDEILYELVSVPPDPSGRPSPGLKLEFRGFSHDPPLWTPPIPPTPTAESPDPPQPITPPGSIYQQGSGQNLRAFNLGGFAQRLSLTGLAAQGALNVGLIPQGKDFGLEVVVNGAYTQTLDSSPTQLGGSAAAGVHGWWGPQSNKFNLAVYVLGGNVWGQNPPQMGGGNGTIGVTAVAERLFGQDRDHPWLTLGANLNVGSQHYLSVSATGQPSTPPPPSTFLSDSYNVGGAVNATAGLFYSGKTPRLNLWGEIYANYSWGSPFTPSGGSPLPTGNVGTLGGSGGAVLNLPFGRGGLHVISFGIFGGVRGEWDTIGGSRFGSGNLYGGGGFGYGLRF